jgi:hypothetical protein
MQSSNPTDMAYDDGYRAGKAEMQQRISELEVEVQNLERIIAEARKDTERLDWLDKGGELRECPSWGGYDIVEWQSWEVTADAWRRFLSGTESFPIDNAKEESQ